MTEIDYFSFFMTLTLAFVILSAWGLICRAIVSSKGYDESDNHGFAWGFWLNIIGMIVCIAKPSVLNSDYYANRNSANQAGGIDNQPASDSFEWKCKSCGSMNDKNAIECRNCGALKNSFGSIQKNEDTWVCNCGARNPYSFSICQKCGKSNGDITSNDTKVVPISMPEIKPIVLTPEKPKTDLSQAKKELVELKSMLDEGLITEEEFTAKKKQILGI